MLLGDGPLPPIRHALEAVPVQHEGKPMFVLRDLEGLTQDSMAISPSALMVASLLDGKRTAADISAALVKSSGAVLPAQEILSVVAQLEKSGLLETAAVADKRKAAMKAYLESPVRPARHKGTAYPSEPLELAKSLGRFYNHPLGPGKELGDGATVKTPPLGLIAPHIDFQRGGYGYAWSYQALSEGPPPDLIVAIGVAHASPNSPWVATRKAYDTPYGPLPASPELLKDLQDCLWYDMTEEELAHKDEHSLEFAALWLKYLWRDKTPAWAPILASSFERFCADSLPSQVPTIEGAINKMGEKLLARKRAGQNIMVLAAVDLAHVGPRFGDDLELDEKLRAKIEREDQAALELAIKLDADGFHKATMADGHWRKVCGHSAIYTAVRLIRILCDGKPVTGHFLTYAQEDDPAGGVVSFASAIFPS